MKKYMGYELSLIHISNIEMVLIGITIQLVVSDPTIYNIYNGVKKVVEQGYTKPIAILPFIEGTRNQDVAEKFREIGVPILPSPKYAFSALSHLSKYIAYDCTKRELSLSLIHIFNDLGMKLTIPVRPLL